MSDWLREELPLRLRVTIEYDDWIQRSHKPKTQQMIEWIIEWVEERETPFTTRDVCRGVPGSYACVTQTLSAMRKLGWVVYTSRVGGKRFEMLSIDMARKSSQYRIEE